LIGPTIIINPFRTITHILNEGGNNPPAAAPRLRSPVAWPRASSSRRTDQRLDPKNEHDINRNPSRPETPADDDPGAIARRSPTATEFNVMEPERSSKKATTKNSSPAAALYRMAKHQMKLGEPGRGVTRVLRSPTDVPQSSRPNYLIALVCFAVSAK